MGVGAGHLRRRVDTHPDQPEGRELDHRLVVPRVDRQDHELHHEVSANRAGRVEHVDEVHYGHVELEEQYGRDTPTPLSEP